MNERSLPSTSGVLPVSQLTRYLKYIVERDELLTALSVVGEICEFSRSAAGHQYFTLKDDDSQVACVLFRREAARQIEEIAQLRKGIVVIVHGFLTVYEPRGVYQIYVERVQIRGAGDAARRLALLRDKLEGEGLFAVERKRVLPNHPRTVALITSRGSQAYHDVLHRLRTQYPFLKVVEAGVSVQGDGAADEIVLAIDIVNRLTDVEVILLVRGGGAPEDLAAFNDERLARAVFSSRIPVVTGIGHETDSTLCDLVADVRAATPSLAAAAAVPDVRALVQRASMLHREMGSVVQQRLQQERARWLAANRSLLYASPRNRLQHHRQRMDELLRATNRATTLHVRAKKERLRSARAQLGVLDPLSILSRGYAVLTDSQTGKVVKSAAGVVPGQALHARLAEGEIRVSVEG